MVFWILKQLITLVNIDFKLKNKQKFLQIKCFYDKFMKQIKLLVVLQLRKIEFLEGEKINARVCVPPPNNRYKNLCYCKMVSWMLKLFIELVSIDFKLKNKLKYLQKTCHYDAFMKQIKLLIVVR